MILKFAWLLKYGHCPLLPELEERTDVKEKWRDGVGRRDMERKRDEKL